MAMIFLWRAQRTGEMVQPTEEEEDWETCKKQPNWEFTNKGANLSSIHGEKWQSGKMVQHCFWRGKQTKLFSSDGEEQGFFVSGQKHQHTMQRQKNCLNWSVFVQVIRMRSSLMGCAKSWIESWSQCPLTCRSRGQHSLKKSSWLMLKGKSWNHLENWVSSHHNGIQHSSFISFTLDVLKRDSSHKFLRADCQFSSSSACEMFIILMLVALSSIEVPHLQSLGNIVTHTICHQFMFTFI